LLLRWPEIYSNTEVLSPVDRETWRVIGEASEIGASSRVIELASGKGAFASYLAKNFGCSIEGFDHNSEFVDYSNNRARELGLQQRVRFNVADINQLEVADDSYDLGVCLGALYIFRENGWKVLTRAVKSGGHLAISDMLHRKAPAPKAVMDVFFEDQDQPLTLEDARHWYTDRGVRILQEEVCSQMAWLDYYDLTKKMLLQISKNHFANKDLQAEVEEGLREDRLVRKYRQQYIDYVTFIMRKV